MKQILDLAVRSSEEEIMDDLEMQGKVLEKSLDEIAWINKYLGGNNISYRGLQSIIRRDPQKHLHVADWGCGGGDGLRYLAKRTKKYEIKFVGIDANDFTLTYAREKSSQFPNISYQKENILDETFTFEGIDVIVLSLFLHHFTNPQILKLFKKCQDSGVRYIIINDLQRHPLPYVLFYLVSKTLRFSQMAHNDGLLSIKKGFKRHELVQLATQAGIVNYTLTWKWAFRYLCVLDLQKITHTS